MNRNSVFLFKRFFQSIAFWTFAMFCYAIFRFYGLEQEIGISIKEGFQEGIFIQPIIILSFLGFGLGVLYALLDFVIEKYVSKKVS